jgi:hypothetical protein
VIVTIELLQEIADGLIWEVPEDAKPIRRRDEDWNTGFAAGWNSALRELAGRIDSDATLETKPYHMRIRTTGSP